jgi:hypothetical protein
MFGIINQGKENMKKLLLLSMLALGIPSLPAMTTQPNAVYTVFTFQGSVVIPVPKNLWQFFSTKAQAQAMLAKVQQIDPTALLTDGLNSALWIPVTYMDSDTKIWVISGKATQGHVVGFTGDLNNPDQFEEFAGSLYDRSVVHNFWVDRPGDVLSAYEIAPGLAELHFGSGN